MFRYLTEKWGQLVAFQQYGTSDKCSQLREELLERFRSAKYSRRIKPGTWDTNPNPLELPFSVISDQCLQIRRRKQVINALFHMEMALRDVDGIRGLLALTRLIPTGISENKTYKHVKDAVKLLLNLDIDPAEIFGREFELLRPIWNEFRTFTADLENYGEYFTSVDFNFYQLSRKVGLSFGALIHQLGHEASSSSGDEVEPSYLITLEKQLRGFYLSIAKNQPNMDEEGRRKLYELQESGLVLLKSLNKTRSSQILSPFKLLHYIRLIDHAIRLSMSIYEHIGLANAAAQDHIRKKIKQLKEDILPELMGLIDKAEAHELLNPGELSKSAMDYLVQHYQLLIGYAKVFVEFKEENEALTTLNDGVFAGLRLRGTYRSLSEENEELARLIEARGEAINFFKMVSENRGPIIDYNFKLKESLMACFKLIEPHVLKTDRYRCNAIINCLMTNRSPETTSYFTKARQMVGSDPDGLCGRDLNGLKRALFERLDRGIETCRFQILLYQDIIAAVRHCEFDEHSQTMIPITSQDSVPLFIYDSSHNPYEVNEAKALGINLMKEESPLPFIVEHPFSTLLDMQALSDLTVPFEIKDAQALCRYYQTKISTLETAHNAFIKFYDLLEQYVSPEEEHIQRRFKNDLIHLYAIFQPYSATLFSTEIMGEGKERCAKFDEDMRCFLSLNHKKINKNALNNVLLNKSAMDNGLNHIRRLFQDRHQVFSRFVKQQQNEKPLHVHPVVKESKYQTYLDFFRAFRGDFEKILLVFNGSVNAELKHKAPRGLPFPELDIQSELLKQSGQILIFKRIFNLLYYLEVSLSILVDLDKLNEAEKNPYIGQVINLAVSINGVYQLFQALKNTPAISEKIASLQSVLDWSYDVFMQMRRPHIPKDNGANTPPVPKYSSLFYTVNSVMVLPEQMAQLRQTMFLSLEQGEAIQRHSEQMVTDIQRIFHKCDSYVSLVFELVVMKKLYHEISEALASFAKQSHEVVVANLKDINEDKLTGLKQKADHFEIEFCLKPGTITIPLKSITDGLFQGLLASLGNEAKIDIALVTSPEPIKKRLESVGKMKEQLIIEGEELSQKKERLNRLADRIDSSDLQDAVHINALCREFQNAFEILCEHKDRFFSNEEPSTTPGLDELLNNKIPDGKPKLSNIERLTKACQHHFDGLLSAQQLKLAALIEQEDFLKRSADQQAQDGAAYVERYPAECFTTEVNRSVSAQNSFPFYTEEYHSKLRTFLNECQASIVSRARAEEQDIHVTIRQQVELKTRVFEEKHSRVYSHLEAVRRCSEKLMCYLSNSDREIRDELSKPIKKIEASKARLEAYLCQVEQQQTLGPLQEIRNKMRELHSNLAKTDEDIAKETKDRLEKIKNIGTTLSTVVTEQIRTGVDPECNLQLKRAQKALECLSDYTQKCDEDIAAERSYFEERGTLQAKEKAIGAFVAMTSFYENQTLSDFASNIIRELYDFDPDFQEKKLIALKNEAKRALQQFKPNTDKKVVHQIKKEALSAVLSIKPPSRLASNFENKKTLMVKKRMINRFIELASDASIDPVSRLFQLRAMVQAPAFSKTMTQYHTYHSGTFAWLKKCLLSLLETLRLYTPKPKALCNDLTKATACHGIFAKTAKRKLRPDVQDDIRLETWRRAQCGVG